MTATSSVLAELAQQARAIRWESIPEAIRRQGLLCVLDTLGCVLAGTRTEEAALVLACEPGSANPGDITIVGTSQRRSLHSALRIQGYLGDVLELNDLIGGHASIGNVTAALALAQYTGATGIRTAEAVVRAIETTARVYDAVYPSLKRYTELGMVPVAFPSAIGCAAGAAHLLDLDAHTTLHAMAIAGSLSGWCPAEVVFGNGGTVKPMLFGAQPADIGVKAAFYAKAGMTGPVDLLESPVGYFVSASTAGCFDAEKWSSSWALFEPRRKLHACCGYLHAPVDAMAAMQTRLGSALQGSSIEVRVSPYVADVVSKPRLPTSPNDARFHLQYCLALVLCGASVILPEHSIDLQEELKRPEVLEAIKRIQVVPASELAHYHQCELRVTDAKGTLHSLPLNGPRGSPQHPLSDQEVQAKFMRLAEPLLGHERSMRLAQQTLELAAVDNVRDWLEQWAI